MSTAKLIILRGLPGSGKSTLARQLCNQKNLKHVEADMYFENEDGQYLFVKRDLPQAHQWCFEQACRWLEKGEVVVVSNTFVQFWEMAPYINYCKEKAIEFDVRVCRGSYSSTHDVPKEAIERMRRIWQE